MATGLLLALGAIAPLVTLAGFFLLARAHHPILAAAAFSSLVGWLVWFLLNGAPALVGGDGPIGPVARVQLAMVGAAAMGWLAGRIARRRRRGRWG